MLPPWIADLMRAREARAAQYAPSETQGIDPRDGFIAAHLSGYGQVDSPSPWGYNRDTFNAEHPNYQGGYYNPNTGFYNSPTEVPFTASGPGGPVMVGTGGTPMPLGQNMQGLPQGGSSEQMPMSPESSGSMPGAMSQPDHQPDEAPPQASYSDMLSTYMENQQTSNGT